jgi:ABC-type transporter Mla subunit MlaD
VKTDTRAVLKLKGITGVVFVELNGGAPNAKTLVAATPEGQVPEIPSEKSPLSAVLDQLPRILEKFSGLEDQVKKVATDVGGLTGTLKEDPSQLIFGKKDKSKAAPQTAPSVDPKTRDHGN